MTTVIETTDDATEMANAEGTAQPTEGGGRRSGRRVRWRRLLVYGLLPGLALVLAMTAGYLKWLDSSPRGVQLISIEAARVASDSTVAMLSYKPGTVENDLNGARERLTGSFKDSYTSLTRDMVIPGSMQQQITAQAKVVATAPVSASEDRAVVLIFVDQTVITGSNAPTVTASSVRVTLDKIDGRWLISQFDPV